jgi:signal transduction histidine kinase
MDSLLQRAAGEASRSRWRFRADLWNTLVDPNQLENVLLNLVINARDAMDGKGKVTIALETWRSTAADRRRSRHAVPASTCDRRVRHRRAACRRT